MTADQFSLFNVIGDAIEPLWALSAFFAITAAGVFVWHFRPAKRSSRLQEKWSRLALDSLLDGLMFVDADEQILHANPAACAMFGYSGSEMAGQSVSSLFCRKDWAQERESDLGGLMRGEGQASLRMEELKATHRDGSHFHVTVVVSRLTVGRESCYAFILRDISEEIAHTEELRRVVTAVEGTADSIAIYDRDGKLVYVNRAYERHTGWHAGSALGKLALDLNTSDLYYEIAATVSRGRVWSGHLTTKMRDGRYTEEEGTISPVIDHNGRITHFVSVTRDISEKIKLEQRLAQAQKLESIGQLASGIAHEINTPTQYVGDNTRFFKDAFSDIEELFETLDSLKGQSGCEASKRLYKALEKADVAYLRNEIPLALEQSIEGIERVSKIVQAMKEFSHPGQEKTLVDVNTAIRSTITVATNEWKYVADVHQDYDQCVPALSLHRGLFNQVILNLIINASQAIAEKREITGSHQKGSIWVSTSADSGSIKICIADTGVGIPPRIIARVFDPFFTTKEVGEGTGQGLSIAHDVIVNKHGGTIDVESEEDVGTTFTIRLPMNPEQG